MKSLVQEKALSCLCFDSQSKGLMENQEPNKYGHVKESKSPCKQVRIQVLENVSSAWPDCSEHMHFGTQVVK